MVLCRFYGWTPDTIEDLSPAQFGAAFARVADIIKWEQKGDIPPPRQRPRETDQDRMKRVAQKAGLRVPASR